MFLLCIILLNVGGGASFLLQNKGVNSTLSTSEHELLSLIVDEKASRHQLEDRVTALSGRLDNMDQLHQQVSVQLDKDKNIREDLLAKLVNINFQLRNLTGESVAEKEKLSQVQQNVEAVRDKFENETANMNAVISTLFNNNRNLGQNVSKLWANVEDDIMKINKTVQKYSEMIIPHTSKIIVKLDLYFEMTFRRCIYNVNLLSVLYHRLNPILLYP